MTTRTVELAFSFNEAQQEYVAMELGKKVSELTSRDLRNYIVDRVQGRGTFGYSGGMAVIKR